MKDFLRILLCNMCCLALGCSIETNVGSYEKIAVCLPKAEPTQAVRCDEDDPIPYPRIGPNPIHPPVFYTESAESSKTYSFRSKPFDPINNARGFWSIFVNHMEEVVEEQSPLQEEWNFIGDDGRGHSLLIDGGKDEQLVLKEFVPQDGDVDASSPLTIAMPVELTFYVQKQDPEDVVYCTCALEQTEERVEHFVEQGYPLRTPAPFLFPAPYPMTIWNWRPCERIPGPPL